jgi:hypothetical protein
MGRKRQTRIGTAALALGLGVTSLMSGADRLTGTWELNIGKSKPEPGFSHRRVTLNIEQTGPDTTRWLFDQLTKDGQKRPVEIVYTFDGAERPVQINGTTSMITAKIVDGSTRTILSKRNGKVFNDSVWKLSSDGNVLTVTSMHRPEGKPAYETIFVYER